MIKDHDRIYHVYPTNDRKEHSTGLSEYCACQPVVERFGREARVIHNSYDGREFFEIKQTDDAAKSQGVDS